LSTAAGGVLTTEIGRLRLGWRLLGFVVLFVVAWALLAASLPSGLVWSTAAMLAAGLVAGWALLALDGRRPAALGFHLSSGSLPEGGKGLALGSAVGLLVVVVIAALGGTTWTPQDGTAGAWIEGAIGALLFFTLPAAAEEAVLRGYPLQALSEAWGAAPALVVTSVAFGVLHLGNPGVTMLGIANVAAAGALLGVVYLKTASLWWATGTHLGWNWSHGYLADLPVSGHELIDAPLYDGVPGGAAWVGGGAFGPEGSVVATLLLLAAALVCWRSPRMRPGRAARAARPLWISEEAPGLVPGRSVTELDEDGVGA